MSQTQFGTFAELLALCPENLRPILQRLQEILFRIHPEAVEVVRMGDRAATYGVGPQKIKHGYAYLLPHKSWINLGFFQRALLPDPENLLEGTGAKMRHVKVRSLAETEQAGLVALIQAAIAERRATLGQD